MARAANPGPGGDDRWHDAITATVAFVLGVLGALSALSLVFALKIGPVIAVIDESAGHGVHSGDLLAVPLTAAAAALFTISVASADRVLRRSPTPWR